MTTVAVPPTVHGGDSKVGLRAMVRSGLIGGAVLFLVVGVGMFEAFNARKIIDPFLSGGYLAILWVPIVFGYRITVRPKLEGVAVAKAGMSNLTSGAVVGAVAGAILGLVVIITDTFNIRDTFLNLSPSLVELLSFGGSAPSGAAVITLAGAVLGALGGALHLASQRVKMILATVFITIVGFSFLELVVGDVLRSADLRTIDNWIYSPARGVRPLAALIFSVAAVGLRLASRGRGRRITAAYRAADEKMQRRWMLVIGLVSIALGAFLPSLFGTFLNDILSTVGLFILLGLGLNIVVGYAGLLDLGYVAFFAVGAYTAALVTSPRSPAITPELAFFEALPFVLLAATMAGLIIGTPVIRMRGDYLAIVTLGFGEIIRIALLSEWLSGVFGGAQGILRIAPLEPGGAVSGIRTRLGYVLAAAGLIMLVIGVLKWLDARRVARDEVEPLPNSEGNGRKGLILMAAGAAALITGALFPDIATWTVVGIRTPDMFRITLVFVAVAVFVSWRLRESRVGRAWMAVREDEQIAQSMGINIVTTKLLAFVMGAMLASLGGALFAVKLGTIFPHSFEIIQSIIILVVVIVGGMGSIKGVIIGAAVLIGVLGGPTQVGLLREMGEFKLLVYGVILVWMMLKRPEGLWPETRRARELHQEEMGQDSWLRAAGDGHPPEDEGP
jgi:branched-chain amino acid transport system permease protein